jgi:hypothetical protein
VLWQQGKASFSVKSVPGSKSVACQCLALHMVQKDQPVQAETRARSKPQLCIIACGRNSCPYSSRRAREGAATGRKGISMCLSSTPIHRGSHLDSRMGDAHQAVKKELQHLDRALKPTSVPVGPRLWVLDTHAPAPARHARKHVRRGSPRSSAAGAAARAWQGLPAPAQRLQLQSPLTDAAQPGGAVCRPL